jgi:tRNA U55 pseudouridine synthase TruB
MTFRCRGRQCHFSHTGTLDPTWTACLAYHASKSGKIVSITQQHWFEYIATVFLRITQYIGDTHNARTLIPMNTRTQTLPLGASSKTVPANPQD